MPNPLSKKNEKIQKILRVYSNNSKHMHTIGLILTNPLSRNIYALLLEKELSAKAIAEIVYHEKYSRLSNISSILKGMTDCGLVIKRGKRKKKFGHLLSYYRAIPVILIVPLPYKEKIITSKALKNSLYSIFSTFDVEK